MKKIKTDVEFGLDDLTIGTSVNIKIGNKWRKGLWSGDISMEELRRLLR